MANDFDNFPVYDPIVSRGTTTLSNVWMDFLATHIETLQSYLGQYGLRVPNISQNDRDSIQNPQNGQLIYNITAQQPQMWVQNAWVNILN